jgi:hypothetical protein
VLIKPFSNGEAQLLFAFFEFDELIEHADEFWNQEVFIIFVLTSQQMVRNYKRYFQSVVVIFREI